MVRWSGLKRLLERLWRLDIQQTKNLGRIIGFAILVALILLALFRIDQGKMSWAEWTGLGADSTINIERDSTGKIIKTVEVPQSGKSLWDLLSVLVFPGLLAFLGIRFQQLQQKQASEEAKEEILQAYFDRISILLIDKNVIAIAIKINKARESQEEGGDSAPLVRVTDDRVTEEEKELLNAAVDVISARTLSILRRLGRDTERKGDVIRFLAETEIASKLRLSLRGVDLSRVNLSRANLSGADFSSTDLSNIDLYKANLSYANLYRANLSRADLFKANFSDADLNGANLDHANLKGASLLRANLSRVYLGDANLLRANFSDADLSDADLSNAQYDNFTRLPRGIDPEARGMVKIEPNQSTV